MLEDKRMLAKKVNNRVCVTFNPEQKIYKNRWSTMMKPGTKKDDTIDTDIALTGIDQTAERLDKPVGFESPDTDCISRSLKLNNRTLHYTDAGKGEPVVFIHCSTANAQQRKRYKPLQKYPVSPRMPAL